MACEEAAGKRKTGCAAPALLLCAALSWTTRAAASSAEELRGVRTFTINVESLDEHAMKCALSTQAIEASAKSVLQRSKIVVRPPGSPNPDTFLYYNVNVISLPNGQCFYSFSLDAQLIGALKIGTRVNVGAYTAWHKAGIRSTFNANAAKTLSYDIEDVTRSFVAAWSEANPERPASGAARK
jgi:hypothetical protein